MIFRWVEYNAQCFQNEGYSSCYWEFCDGFGFFNKETKTLDEAMVQAILDPHDIPLVPTITTNTDEIGYAILNSKFSISMTVMDAQEFRLQQFQEDTNTWDEVTSYIETEEQYADGAVKVTFESSTNVDSSWGSPSAFRILATNVETGETIESNVMVRKVVSEIPEPAVVDDLPESTTVHYNEHYYLNATFSDANSFKIFQVLDDSVNDVTGNYTDGSYTLDGIYYVTAWSGAVNETYTSPAYFYIEATGYDGSTVRTSTTERIVLARTLAISA